MSGNGANSVMITNFLRYPGSKRRMLGFLSAFLPAADSITGCYVEPFIGSGAVFLFVSPRRAFLSDINSELIDLYRGIRLNPPGVWERYCEFGKTKADYHRIRALARPRLLVNRAARILYINRTCFKGMWRHNQRGQFNVGYGGQSRRWVIDEASLTLIAQRLRHAQIKCLDFEAVIDACVQGDFLFLDPPYRPGERELINDHYIGRQFTYQDHQRLAKALRRATQRGVRWLMTTSAHPDIAKLFRGNSIVSFPRGTGGMPGKMVSDSGEILVLNYIPSKETG